MTRRGHACDPRLPACRQSRPRRLPSWSRPASRRTGTGI